MIRELFEEVGKTTYNYRGNRDQAVFQILKDLSSQLEAIVPPHFITKISQGVGSLPMGLWVGILDPDVTTSPTRGIYVVFLFNEDRTEVSLSLNQAVTAAGQRAKTMPISTKTLLRHEAETIRRLLKEDTHGLTTTLHLGASKRVSEYEAGNIFGKTWTLDAMPPDDEIIRELARFLDLYANVIAASENAVLQGHLRLPPREPTAIPETRQRKFTPKNGDEYRAQIKSVTQTRQRSHERLIASLGIWAGERGYEPNTNVHPRDLLLHHDQGPDCLVEVKVFPTGRPYLGIRECIGQLFEYREFYQDPRDNTRLVAALSENPGDAYLSLLFSLDIATLWPISPHTWHGCNLARQFGLID
ncbi:MrcB family domain-containing protein [Haloglycomyces albus]|uniref:MrcB family domain-containing protein n=1 Tax=Haloglycomyces albus TaxID=526067 RepID=UPI00046D7FFE|nr:DUF3578 domain-containing protein [Haloglycomyces albus]